MADARALLALTGSPSGGEQNPLSSVVLMGLIFSIFYFILILPMKTKQRKLEDLLKALKAVKFTGHIAIEYEANPNDPSPDMKKCVAYIKDAAAKLG